jgi:hypothetical protein
MDAVGVDFGKAAIAAFVSNGGIGTRRKGRGGREVRLDSLGSLGGSVRRKVIAGVYL